MALSGYISLFQLLHLSNPPLTSSELQNEKSASEKAQNLFTPSPQQAGSIECIFIVLFCICFISLLLFITSFHIFSLSL
jgi:hypothetical protein